MVRAPSLISESELGSILAALQTEGYTLAGPRIRGAAIVFDEISDIDDLPRGRHEEQTPGLYQLGEEQDQTRFSYCSTAQSLKGLFHPPQQVLFAVRRSANGPRLVTPAPPERRLALIGVRGCDLAALGILDCVLGSNDDTYQHRRAGTFIVAVNCTAPSKTCFCTSMGTGPAVNPNPAFQEPTDPPAISDGGVTHEFDLSLTELPRQGPSEFVLQVGSERGERLLQRLTGEGASINVRPATDAEQGSAKALVESARQSIRTLHRPADSLRAALTSALESPAWDDVAERCLACANCTMACPTCFCSTTEEQTTFSEEATDFEPQAALQFSREQTWDSCFTTDYSELHGTPVRSSTKARYRQWLVHKFSTWWDQFGSSGCVGCGRCVTWCPVGIDIVEVLNDVCPGQPS